MMIELRGENINKLQFGKGNATNALCIPIVGTVVKVSGILVVTFSQLI